MSRILADLKAYSLEYFRNPVGAFFTFAFPVLLIVIFGAVFSTSGSPNISLPVQDLDGTPASAAFVDALNATGVLEVSEIPDTAEIEEYIRDNSLARALVIPNGFQASLVDPNTTHIVLYGDPTQSNTGIATQVVYSVIEDMNFRLAAGPNATKALVLEPRNVPTTGTQDFTFIDYFVPGLVGFTVMINTLFILSAASAEFKSRGFFKLLATTPITRSEWLFSKFLWSILTMVLSVAFMFAVAIPLYGAQLTITPLAVAILVVGILLFTAMGLLIGVWAKNPEGASAMGNAIGFPMMFLSGTFFQLEAMPEVMQIIAYVFPLTYMSQGLRDTMVYGNDAAALVSLAILAVLAVVFYAAASWLMTWTEK